MLSQLSTNCMKTKLNTCFKHHTSTTTCVKSACSFLDFSTYLSEFKPSDKYLIRAVAKRLFFIGLQ